MSELPEIESVVHFLKPHLINRKVESVTLEKENILVNKTKEELISSLIDRTIIDFKRRGKILSFIFDDESSLYIHPRMVGQLITCPKKLPEIKHTHFIMKFDNNEEFRYIDVRRLGKLYYLKKDEKDTVTGISKLGLEYDDKKLNEKVLKETLSKHYRKSIKEVLLNQSIIAGIGNIYADEILFDAKISPRRNAGYLKDTEIKRLLKSIKGVLKYYVEVNKSVGYEEYLKGEGRDFENMHTLRLYDSKICPVCETELERIKISSRGTVYCPNCQK